MNNKRLQRCNNCGGYFSDEAMADWTICFKCSKESMEVMTGEKVVYQDNLGISWTQQEITDAGGINEIKKMAYDADTRNN